MSHTHKQHSAHVRGTTLCKISDQGGSQGVVGTTLDRHARLTTRDRELGISEPGHQTCGGTSSSLVHYPNFHVISPESGSGRFC